ncbi:hypothetical protein E4U22_000353 [Claviceps purpurea]|nr:hypothetical protein E4U22_000353 [Claviceps purpurea]
MYIQHYWNPLLEYALRSWKPLAFPSEGFALISADENIEEETFPDHVASQFYPVKIGDIFRDRYQIVGKLGYGVTSTVWLARDLSGCRHVALKIYVTSNEMGEMQDVELDAYNCEFCVGISIPESKPLNQRETVLEGEDRDCFSRFMRKMLQWDPEKRSSAKELAEDEWVLKHY